MTRDVNHGEALNDDLLQRYHDDELSAAERVRVEAQLDGDARARLLALAELGSLLRAHSEQELEDADLSASLDATRLAIERGGAPPVGAVSPGGGARRRSPSSGLRSAALVGGLLACVAAVALFLLPGRGGDLAANDAEVETLEVEGSVATVFRIEHGADPEQSTTVIWAALEEDDDDAPEGVVVPTEIDEDEREAL